MFCHESRYLVYFSDFLQKSHGNATFLGFFLMVSYSNLDRKAFPKKKLAGKVY